MSASFTSHSCSDTRRRRAEISDFLGLVWVVFAGSGESEIILRDREEFSSAPWSTPAYG